MRIFLSHSSADYVLAEKICNLIEENGASCFIAPRDIRSGKEYAEEIINGINEADAMVVVMSVNANKSPHVLREVERAVSRSIPILVYKVEDVELTKSMEYFLMTHQWILAEKDKQYEKIIDFVLGRENEKIVSEQKETIASVPEKRRQFNKNYLIIGGLLFVIVILSVCLLLSSKSEQQDGEEQYVTEETGGRENGTVAENDEGSSEQEAVDKENEQEPADVSVAVGDTITLGNYNDCSIDWRVLRISEDGSQAVLIAKDILTMKAYDAPEGGSFNRDDTQDYWGPDTEADTDFELQIQVRGNSDWSASNIRTWLNSSAEVVAYADQAPVPSAMSEHCNGYHTEPGFLYGFSEEELQILVETEIITPGNELSSEDVVTSDRVFLLSMDELQWFEDAGISLYAAPTKAAMEQDDSNWYYIETTTYSVEEYYWWLREPVPGTASKCYMVSNGYWDENILDAQVGTEGFGIRPAIVIDLNAYADFIK